MTAAELQALAAQKRAETLEYQGRAEQHRLTGLTFGQPACNTHLIQKLRRLDPALLAELTQERT